MLAEYNKETGATILVSSHNLNHTTDVCPRIALLENGIIIRDIDNSDRQAESELDSYFNVDFTDDSEANSVDMLEVQPFPLPGEQEQAEETNERVEDR